MESELRELDATEQPVAEIYHVSGRDESVPALWRDHESVQTGAAALGLLDLQWTLDDAPVVFPAQPNGARLPDLQTGMRVELGGQRLEVSTLAGAGHRAKVYQMMNLEDRMRYALKVIHDTNSVNVRSISREALKVQVLASHGLPAARVLAAGSDFALKQWIDGVTGDEWLRTRREAFEPELFGALFEFYRRASAARVAIENLKPANLMLDETGRWIPIDPGRITVGQPPTDVFAGYMGSFVRKWIGIKPYAPRVVLATLLNRLG